MASDGLCECGCGGLTPIAKRNHKGRGWIKGEPISFIHGHHRKGKAAPWKKQYGSENPAWNGGKTSHSGYILTQAHGHPRANNAGYVFEHILVLEKALGRPILPTEATHHIDGNRANNAIGNLMLFKTNGMHIAFHARLRAFEASGHWDWRQCCFCHQYDDPINLTVSKRPTGRALHKHCRNEDDRRRNARV